MANYARFIDMLEYDPSLIESEKRAYSFLQAQALITAELGEVDHNVMILHDLVDVVYAQLYHAVPEAFAKTVDSRKSWVLVQAEHIEAQRKYAEAKAKQDELKRLYYIFENAHLLNRQRVKDLHSEV